MMARITDWTIVHSVNCVLLGALLDTLPRTIVGGTPVVGLVVALLILVALCWSSWSCPFGDIKSEVVSSLVGALIVAGILEAIAVLFGLHYFDTLKTAPLAASFLVVLALAMQWRSVRHRRNGDTVSPSRDLVVAVSAQILGLIIFFARSRVHAAVQVPELVRGILLELIVTYPSLMYLRAGRRFVQLREAHRS